MSPTTESPDITSQTSNFLPINSTVETTNPKGSKRVSSLRKSASMPSSPTMIDELTRQREEIQNALKQIRQENVALGFVDVKKVVTKNEIFNNQKLKAKITHDKRSK